MITDEAAEELIESNLEGHSYVFPVIYSTGRFENIQVPIEAVKGLAIKFALLGIEHERKRQEKERSKMLAATSKQFRLPADYFVGNAPIEQVGEKHWRIKDE